MRRRRFLNTTCTVCVGSILGTTKTGSEWFGWFKPNYSTEPVPGIPNEWAELAGVEVYQYANFILSLGLSSVTPRMVIAPHFKSRRCINNCLPPKKLWKKIKPTLQVIDQLANELGTPVKEIVSAYRSPEYNKAVRGNRGSYHMVNNAIDVTFHRTGAWRVARAAKHLRDKSRSFKGGIEAYSSFTHIDTRGYNSTW